MASIELGCGPDTKLADFGIDRIPGRAVDFVHDLNVFPWPLRACAYDRIICLNVLEHLHDLLGAMQEIHRIGEAGAVVAIRVPAAGSPDLFTDPTHVRGFGIHSFDVFVEGTIMSRFRYSAARFGIRAAKYERARGRILWPIDRLVCKFANSLPTFYESRLMYVYPMTSLYFELVVIK